MKKCSECSSKMREMKSKTPEGVEYKYFKCHKCGDEILNMEQLHEVAQEYREMKKYNAKISKWGLSLGLRIPKELVERYKLKDDEEVTIIPEENGIKIIPA
ncbi:AbrB/MazE/SpoVT family DNA-binding domain-containing protein [Nanoarchaeota archaeon]